MGTTNDFLGRGWKFPVQVEGNTGRIKGVAYEEDIKEAIHLILMTRLHERIMLKEFGSGIHRYLFSEGDFTTLHLLKQDVMDALIRWEPRIINLEVQVLRDRQNPSQMNIQIQYTARATNNPYNLVYPFYIDEGIGQR